MPDGQERAYQPVVDDTTGFGSWRHRARYRFDNLLARGTWATLLWLGAVTLAAVLVSSVVLTLAGVTFTGDEASWVEDAWQSLLRVIDPGTMAGDVGWGQRLLALAVTIFGILVAGTLIGIIASGVEDRIERMRRGRSVVIESDHVVVLGTSDLLPLLVRQLQRGRPPGRRPTVVVLADDDPQSLDARIRPALPARAGRVVVRSGDPTDQQDLALVRLSHAAGVVILEEDDGGDSRVAQTVLAVQRAFDDAPAFPVVAQVEDPMVAARLVAACGAWVQPLSIATALARSAVFALRTPGLGHVLADIMEPGGCELRVVSGRDLAGTRFGDLIWRWADVRPIGLIDARSEVVLNPSADTVVAPTDRVAVLSTSDEGELAPPTARRPVAETVEATAFAHAERPPEHLLVVGWSSFGADLLREWAPGAPRSSSVEVVLVADVAPADPPGKEELPGLSVTRTSSLARLVEERGGLGDATTVLLLAADRRTAAEADVDTLLDLGVVQRARRGGERDRPRVVVQVRDLDHAQLVDLDGRDDWLITPGVAGSLLAQLVRQPARRDVLLALYDDAPASSLLLVPATDLGVAGRVTVAELVAAASSRGLLAVGHLRSLPTHDELVLAPRLDTTVELSPDDRVVAVG